MPTDRPAMMDERLRRAAEAARGFMPADEGLALYEAAEALGVAGPLLEGPPADGRRQDRRAEAPGVAGPLLEVGSYCGKSAVYLGAAAQRTGRVLFCVDHHRGSEENQPGWEHHDPEVVDPDLGVIDTLPFFRRTIRDAGLEGVVVAVVGDSPTVASLWATPLAMVFIDGGHGAGPAHRDYEGWSPHVAPGGLLAIHDVFENPAEGGRPPCEIWCRALSEGCFQEQSAVGSLRVLRRV